MRNTGKTLTLYLHWMWATHCVVKASRTHYNQWRSLHWIHHVEFLTVLYLWQKTKCIWNICIDVFSVDRLKLLWSAQCRCEMQCNSQSSHLMNIDQQLKDSADGLWERVLCERSLRSYYSHPSKFYHNFFKHKMPETLERKELLDILSKGVYIMVEEKHKNTFKGSDFVCNENLHANVCMPWEKWYCIRNAALY